MSKKTLEAFEKERGFIILGDIDLKREITEEELLELMHSNGFHGVDFEKRIKFLEDNGYEVTRDNLIDSSLSYRELDII